MSDEKKATAPVLTPLNPPERKRTYHFSGGEKVEFVNVTHFLARPSGTHRLKTADGLFHIVAAGWLSVTMDMDAFTV